jgi:hypothetical protein
MKRVDGWMGSTVAVYTLLERPRYGQAMQIVYFSVKGKGSIRLNVSLFLISFSFHTQFPVIVSHKS